MENVTKAAPRKEQPTVFIVDDDDAFRRSLSRLLGLADFAVESFSSVGDYLMAARKERCGCLLLDMRMPGPDGMELLEHFGREKTGPPVILLTGHGDVPTAVEAMRKGAFDFLTKPVEKNTVVEAIRKAVHFNEQKEDSDRRIRALRERFSLLTPKEKEIFRMVVDGLPNKAIADRAGCAERTVKLHRAHLSRKLGAGCLAELIRFHFEAGL